MIEYINDLEKAVEDLDRCAVCSRGLDAYLRARAAIRELRLALSRAGHISSSGDSNEPSIHASTADRRHQLDPKKWGTLSGTEALSSMVGTRTRGGGART